MARPYERSIDGVKRTVCTTLKVSRREVEIINKTCDETSRASYVMKLVKKDGIKRGILKKDGSIK